MSASDEAIERAIADACFGARADDAFVADLRGFLESRGVAREDVDAVVASPARLGVYRRLVRNNVVGVVTRMLPRARARLNDACAGAFDTDLARFLDEVGPRTHYLRDVPHELLAWAAPQWRARADVPAYLVDLATHELISFAVGAAESASSGVAQEVSLDKPLAFIGSMRLARYAYAVNELPADVDDRTTPAKCDTSLLVYRDADNAVRFLELTPLARAILDRLAAGDPLGAAVQTACSSENAAPTQELLADIARLLANLGERGILLGARED
jgi:hypothetical protein